VRIASSVPSKLVPEVVESAADVRLAHLSSLGSPSDR
jgi:hypothetical protein